MLMLDWKSPRAEQFTERAGIVKLGNDYDWRWRQTDQVQPGDFPLGLFLIANGDTHHVLPLDLVGNKHFGLLVGGQEGRLMRVSRERAASSSLDGFRERRFECIRPFPDQAPVFRCRITGAEFCASAPQVLSVDQKNNPIEK